MATPSDYQATPSEPDSDLGGCMFSLESVALCKQWQLLKETLSGRNARRAKAKEKYAAWNSTLDEYERRFRAMATCVDAFDHPIETGLLMARDDFCRWSASESRDLMLWFVNGEVWIAGVRNSPCHVLAYGAFQQLMLSVNRLAYFGPSALDELDGRLWNGKSYFEVTTGGYHQEWESKKGNNPPIIMHAFDMWASQKYMRTALDLLMQVPGVYLCVGFKPAGTSKSSLCIAIARWRDPDAVEGVREKVCDVTVQTLHFPVKACFEGTEHIPPLLQAHSEKDVTIDLWELAAQHRKWCARAIPSENALGKN